MAKQLVNYVSVKSAVVALEHAAKNYQSLNFAGAPADDVIKLVLNLRQPEPGLLDLSQLCQVLDSCRTAKLARGANRGLDLAIFNIKQQMIRKTKIVPAKT